MFNRASLLGGAACGALLAIACGATAQAQTNAGDTVVSGRMYWDVSNIDQKANDVETLPSGTGYDVKRFYVGIDHKFNDMFSADVTTDFNYVSADSETQVYIKKAYLQATFSPQFIVRIGSADLPWVPFAENVYGFRYVENTLIDRTKFGTSADWGVHVLGSDGGFSYQASVVDGAGYKVPNRSQAVDVEGRVSYAMDGFTVAVGGYTGDLGKDTVGAVTHHTAQRFDALASYTMAPVTVGVEYFQANDWTAVTSVAGDSADGYSVFGNVTLTPKVKVFARYDNVTPTKDTAPLKKDTYYNGGIDYSPFKNIDFAATYKHEEVVHGTLSTSNGTIGGSKDGTYDEFGVFGQLRW